MPPNENTTEITPPAIEPVAADPYIICPGCEEELRSINYTERCNASNYGIVTLGTLGVQNGHYQQEDTDTGDIYETSYYCDHCEHQFDRQEIRDLIQGVPGYVQARTLLQRATTTYLDNTNAENHYIAPHYGGFKAARSLSPQDRETAESQKPDENAEMIVGDESQDTLDYAQVASHGVECPTCHKFFVQKNRASDRFHPEQRIKITIECCPFCGTEIDVQALMQLSP